MSAMPAARAALWSITSSSFSGGVGGGSKAIVLGEDLTADPCASPRLLAARRSPDKLRSILLNGGVDVRLLAALNDLICSGLMKRVALLAERLL